MITCLIVSWGVGPINGGRPVNKTLQDGWTIEYRGWFAGDPPLPQKVFARQGEAGVRLVVEEWDAP